MSYELKTVASVNFEAYVDAFNLAYSDYFVPMNLSIETMQSLIEREDISLDDSLVAVDGKRIIGMCMLAIRGKRGWIGGMGVIPDYRRQGIARNIMANLLDRAKACGLRDTYLEVITQNVGAYALYEDIGFRKTRILAILDRGSQDSIDSPANGYMIQTVDATTVFPLFNDFHDSPLPWQRSFETIQYFALNTPLICTVITTKADTETILGYALAWISSQRIQYIDVAVDPKVPLREEIGVTLIEQLHQKYPNASGGIVNIGEDDVMLQPMQSVGYRQTLRQYEMHYAIE